MVMSLGQSGIIFSVPVFLQAVRGYDALQTGLSLLPMSLTLIVVAPLGAFLSAKVSPKLLINLGLFVNILAMLVLRFSLSVKADSWNLAPGMILFGLGMGLVMSQINNLTLSAVSVQESGEASGVNNTLRQVGASFGAAIIGAVLLGALSQNITQGINKSTIIPASSKPQIVQAVAAQTSNVEFGGGARLATQVPARVSQEIISISHQATVDANKVALTYGAAFALLGFLLSFALPNVKNVERGQSLASARH